MSDDYKSTKIIFRFDFYILIFLIFIFWGAFNVHVAMGRQIFLYIFLKYKKKSKNILEAISCKKEKHYATDVVMNLDWWCEILYEWLKDIRTAHITHIQILTYTMVNNVFMQYTKYIDQKSINHLYHRFSFLSFFLLLSRVRTCFFFFFVFFNIIFDKNEQMKYFIWITFSFFFSFFFFISFSFHSKKKNEHLCINYGLFLLAIE